MRILISMWVGFVALLLSTAFAKADDAKIPASFFDLSGPAGLPSYFKCDQGVRGGEKGLTGGVLTSTDADFADKDFTLDVIFEFGKKQDKRLDAAVGIGENGHEGGWLLNSLECRITGSTDKAKAEAVFHHKPSPPSVGNIKSDGPHLLRVQKKGNALTYSLIDKYNGEDPDTAKFTATFTVPDLKSEASFLNGTNAELFITGNVIWRALRLQVAGATVDAGKRSDADLKPVGDDVPFFAMGATSHVPSFLAKPPTEAENHSKFTGDGWQLEQMFRSRTHDYLNKDFTLDVVVAFPPKSHDAFRMGLGEASHEGGGNWLINSITGSMYGPAREGILATSFKDFAMGDVHFGKLSEDAAGPNLFRMQHHGDVLAFYVCTNFTGKFSPEYMAVIPSVRSQASYLDDKTGYVFMGEHGVAEKIRFIVDGKPVDLNAAPVNVPGQIAEVAPPDKTPDKTSPPARAGRADPKTDPAKPAKPGKKPDVAKAPSNDIPPPPDNRPKLALESDKHQLTQGMGGSLLLLEKDQLRRLGPDGFTVADTIKLPGTYQLIAERKNYFVALSDETKSLDLINKQTLKIDRSIQMEYPRRFDLCLSPFKPTCYVTVEKTTGDGYENVVLIVDETNGDVREPDYFRGKYLKISPDGRILYSAYNLIYSRGGYVNGAPDYADIDILYLYDVSGKDPQEIASKDEAGANCTGLAVSPDGRRVSFLSFVGYPLYSKNIAAWDPTDFTKRPIAYSTKDNKADCRHLAFHPELPFVAAAADNGAICFDRDSGRIQKDRLDIPFSFEGTKINDVVFSPDGTNLILDCEQNGDHFLVRVKINLSAEEAAIVKKGPPIPQKPAVKPTEDNGIKA